MSVLITGFQHPGNELFTFWVPVCIACYFLGTCMYCVLLSGYLYCVLLPGYLCVLMYCVLLSGYSFYIQDSLCSFLVFYCI